MSDEETVAGPLQVKTDAFLKDFFEKGEELVRELISENERLREQLESPTARTPITRENMVELLVDRVASLERECDEIRRIAGNVQAESGDYRTRLEALESEHYNLACMYVSGLQFHTATSIDEVLRTITEILLNFLGVGEFSLYVADEERGQLFPIARSSGDPRELSELSIVEGDLTVLRELGRPWTAGDSTYRFGGELMHLPLVAGSRLVGCARLESLLSQKPGFVESDNSLLSLISEHGGIGIETAWIRAHAKEVPLQRQAIEELLGT
jgi:hypothetical protein